MSDDLSIRTAVTVLRSNHHLGIARDLELAVAKLQEENDEARRLLAEWDRKETEGVRRWVELRAENERLRGALEFYADPSTYHGMTIFADPPTGGFGEDMDTSHGDPSYGPKPGKLARAALSSGAAEGGEVEP